MNDVIESRQVRHEGITCTVTLIADTDSTPFDADCYSAEDIDAWRNDRWRYVGVEVKTTMSDAAVWGVEYGWLADQNITFDKIIETHLSDLLAEAYNG